MNIYLDQGRKNKRIISIKVARASNNVPRPISWSKTANLDPRPLQLARVRWRKKALSRMSHTLEVKNKSVKMLVGKNFGR